MANFCYEMGQEGYFIKTEKAGMSRSGTGDIFSAIIAADAVNGVDFHDSVKKHPHLLKMYFEIYGNGHSADRRCLL